MNSFVIAAGLIATMSALVLGLLIASAKSSFTAMQICIDLARTRWLLDLGGGSSIPTAFMVVQIFWLSILFMSFGLFSPRNATVIMVLLVCALSVSGAMFLIEEMDTPFTGLIRVSGMSLEHALSQLGR